MSVAASRRVVGWVGGVAGTALAVLAAAAVLPATAQTGGFEDVAAGAYYSAPVEELAGLGVLTGCEGSSGFDDSRFCPDDPMDRKTMAVWVVRVLEGEDPPPGMSRFPDANALGAFWAPFIEQMAELGITAGCGDGTDFCPNDEVTRAHAAVFLSRAFDLPDGPDPGFSDVPDGAWYYDEAAALAASGITVGCGDGTMFCPHQATSRAQMATFLSRARQLTQAATDATSPTQENSATSVGAGSGGSSNRGGSSNGGSGSGGGQGTTTTPVARTAVTVSFGALLYTATEGGAAANVRVELSAAAERTVTVPLTVTRSGGATTADYTLPAPPTQVTFDVGQRSQTFTVTAVDDSVIDNGESITIGFGTLPAGVTAGGQREAKVSLVDNDHPPDITVSFGAPEYTATEGGAAANVRVELSADPERTIKVNIIAVDHFRAVKGDYVLSTASVTFDAGQTIAEFTVAAVDDSGNDDGEKITLGFGYENAITLPAGVTRGSQTTTQVSLVDNDDPPRGVRFGEHFYTATEGDEDATVIQVILSEARDETVVVPLRVSARNFGASDPDFMLSGLSDMSVTFEPNETTAEFSVTAVDDTGSDDGETIEFRFGNLPSSLTVRYPTFTVVWLKDDDDPPPGPFGRDPSKDVYPLIPPGGTARERSMEPRDLWSDGETLWLLSDKIVEYVFAYDLESSERRSDSDIPIAANSCVGQHCNQIPWPWGLWSDGEILRVLDRTRRAIFAFDLDTGVHRPDLKIAGLELSGVKSAVGMWSDGEIVWVSDIYWDKIFAFELAGGSRSSDHDIDTLKSNGVQDPTSLWSDGVTMWVIDDVDDKLYAFDLATGERKSALDFTLLAAAGNHNLHGIWSDGVTMWVADRNDNRVYAYNMPVSSALKSLSATGVEFGLFQPGVVKYEATVPAGTTSTTVTAEAAFSSSTVAVSYVDADMDTVTGTTVPLTAGNNTITITSTNGDSTHTYTLTVTVPAS